MPSKKLKVNALGQYEYDAEWKVEHLDGDDQ